MSQTITLTETNSEGFDPKAFGINFENCENAQYRRVVKKIKEIKQDHLHCVVLEINDVHLSSDIANPDSDPLIIISLMKTDSEGKGFLETRALWNNLLWKILDDDSAELLELMYGIKKEALQSLTETLLAQQSMNDALKDLMNQ